MKRQHRRNYNDLGNAHELTFSCYRRMLPTIDYIHENPVRRGLVTQARDWKWPSARSYESEGYEIDPDLPTIHGLPPEFFATCRGTS